MSREDLSDAIVACLRAGVVYRHCDTDGYHDEVAFRDGHYVHVTGFRAGLNAPTRLAHQDEALALMRTIHPRLGAMSDVEVLEAILATLQATKP